MYELIKRLEWAVGQPEICEIEDYVNPIVANAIIDDTDMHGFDYYRWQHTIGDEIPLEKVFVNIIGAIFLGKYRDIKDGWDEYKRWDGPEEIINEDIGVIAFWSSKIDLQNGFANRLLGLQSGFLKRRYDIRTILEHLKTDSLDKMN